MTSTGLSTPTGTRRHHTSIAAEQDELVRRWKKGDRAAGTILLEAHEGLVWKIMQRYRGRGLDDEDLLQYGRLGLLDGVARFDPTRGTTIAGFVKWWIRHHMGRALHEVGATIRVPTNAQDKMWKYRLDPGAMPGKLAGWRLLLTPRSLDEPLSEDDSSTLGDCIADSNLTPEDAVGDAQERALAATRLRAALARLTERERDIACRRLLTEEPESLEVIGASYGLTKERIRQIEAAALRKLRVALGAGVP